MKPRARARAGWLAGAALVGAVLIGSHGFVAGTWLSPLLQGAGCPLSAAELDLPRLEQQRRASLSPLRGDEHERAKPALAFELGQTTRSEARAWIEQNGGCCSAASAAALVCEGVALPGELPIESLHLALDGSDRVVSVDLFRRAGSGREALLQLARSQGEIARRAGAVTERSRTLTEHSRAADAAYIEARAFRRVAAEFRYSAYLARLSAMNFGAGVIRVRESYDALPSGVRWGKAR